jgi:hypothetical protein
MASNLLSIIFYLALIPSTTIKIIPVLGHINETVLIASLK